MSATQSWFGTVDDHILRQVGEDRLVVIAIGRRDVAPAQPRLKVVLAHEAPDLLVVHDHALLPQRGSNTAPAVGLELVADGADRLDDRGVVERRRPAHRSRSSARSPSAGILRRRRDPAGPVITDVVALLGRGAFREPPLETPARAPACRQAARARRSAPRTPRSCRRQRRRRRRLPASYFWTQMRIRLRERSWRLARPCSVSPARYSCTT